MSRQQLSDLQFVGGAKITGLPASTANGQAVVHEQLQAAIEGISWKTSARAGSSGNVNLAVPGATIGGVAMATGDRFVARGQTVQSQNGIYIWNGAAAAATRANDANTARELEAATITIEEGTDAGLTFRQQSVNFTLDTDPVVWSSFGGATAPASETVAGVVELATQAEVNAGTDAVRAITPATLAASPFAKKKFNATFGDGTATQFTITHNLSLREVQVQVYRNAAPYDEVNLDVEHTDANTLTLRCAAAPSTNQYAITVLG